MAASDHLSQPQFMLHGSPEKFEPGHVLTREGAWRGAQRRNYPGISDQEIDRKAAYHSRYTGEQPRESHLYYGDHSLMGDIQGMYAGGKGHIYAVQPETSAGRKINKHSPDPHYNNYGGGAYRTTGRLRVLHEVDHEGNPL